MKSLTLHLSVILLLGSLHNANNKLLPSAGATSTKPATVPAKEAALKTPSTTTTLQPPSLPKPQYRTLPPTAATKAMTIVTTAATVSIGRRQPAAIRATSASDDAAIFTSTRLVRNANSSTSANVRQNRSFQSGGASAAIAQRSNNNVADNNKSHRMQLRQSFRTNQYSSTMLPTIAATASSTTPAPLPAAVKQTSASEEQQSLSSFMPHHRQSKQQQQPTLPDSEDSTKLKRTTKTPRMIQRLVAGHIQNAQGRSTYQVSSVTSNSSVSSSSSATTTSTTAKPEAIYSRRKPMISSSYRQSKLSGIQNPTSVSNTTIASLQQQTVLENTNDRDDDEALLDDPGDFDNWDHGILRLSAGAGKENSPKSKKKQEDSKKTLSDQVRDGKYGLIEKELFRREPKRPGVLSYLPNKEVPIDNERNFGGLNEEDIWLAEDHLLVIKGGSLNDDERNEPWPAIDDYDSPGRQIKLPPNPKVPPPFPVQLEDNGPLQFIGNNKFTVVYPVANESVPVYPTGPETNYPSSESDDEKNLLARPGSSQDPTEDAPGYVYPAPSPPWLYHNQTFVNPFLANARPITFPGLGPFPFGRNGSHDNSNVTDFFDEDDPSLYYPPAYSFVYKSNYSNPVPPGPLVPGIVLPPPPNQFSRLEKPSKLNTTPAPAPTRQRVYSTTSTTSTTTTSTPRTTTSTTTSTTQAPYRQVLTQIHQYTPKTITITAAPPGAHSTSIAHPLSPAVTKNTPSPPPTSAAPIEPVPVPVAVPVPIYPAKHFVTPRPNHVAYVPTTSPPAVETFSKSNPIYYEYFEPKREPTTANVIDDFIPTTAKPKIIKIHATSKRPFKPLPNHHRNYLQPLPPQRPYLQENVVYITPKPEIRPYSSYNAPPVFKPRPLENFEREVNALRQTLRFYQNQQLRDNNIPRTPKAKPIYEYSYDASKNVEPALPETRSFQPPAEFDEEPFQPMVTYSPPVDDENAFRAIAYDKVDNESRPTGQQQQPQHQQRLKYQSTTTLIPVQPSPQYQGRQKKLRLGAAKYLEQTQNGGYQQQYPGEFQSTPRTVLTTQPPWVSLDKQELNEFQQHPEEEHQSAPLQQQQQQQQQYQAVRLQIPQEGIAPRNRGFQGYYYGPQPLPGRQNNRFYDQPFQNPTRKIVNNYRPPPPQQQQQHQQQQQPIWSLENDTYVNFAPNRPPLNPDAEFINPYQSAYGNQQRFIQQQQQPLPALSHQSQYYGPPPQQQQRYPLRQLQHPQQPQIPLHRDILVNYRPPLPPLNPQSEYISHPQVVRPLYRSNSYRQAAQVQAPDEPSNVYYITPKYRRGSNGGNNNNKNNANINGGNRQ